MRKTTVVYTCDVCGAEEKFGGGVTESMMVMGLVREGWHSITVKSMSEQGSKVTKDLCRSCYENLTEHLSIMNLSKQRFAKAEIPTVE